MKSWANLEARVRDVASYIWTRPCVPGREAGVNVDAVLNLRPDASIFIEVTERRVLNKVREDINKLITAKLNAAARGIFAQCYSVIEGEVTSSMKEAGKEHFVQVLSVREFEKLFYDFETYRHARNDAPFGSSVNPLTGRRDESSYVPVSYVVEGTGKEVPASEIADWLSNGRHVILLGEYGSGKSRCIREIFAILAEKAQEQFQYPMAVNLRDCWGLKRAGEIVRRHYADLGLEDLQGSAVRAALAQAVIFLLDGFDELGSQVWSSDDQRLRSIRAQALVGIRDLIDKSDSGILIAGREHYFHSNEEMVKALGISKGEHIIVRAKEEFTDEEIERYFEQRGIDVAVPSWLPRRPLIAQTISQLSEAEMDEIFGVKGNEAAFWNHFVRVVATRDSLISASFDPDTILSVLTYLSRITRTKSNNVGPITLEDLQRAFELAVGKMPVEDASVMLQRLPALGRLGPDSAERQFVDVAILDTLRARDVIDICDYDEERLASVSNEPWANPLGDLGQRIGSQISFKPDHDIVRIAREMSHKNNKVLASDLLAVLTRSDRGNLNCENMLLDDAVFSVFTLVERPISNLTLVGSTIYELFLPDRDPENVTISGCVVGHVVGVSSASAFPAWIVDTTADRYDSAHNVAAIRRMGLSIPHEILTTILKKTFFQPGAGRKEEALLRGLGRISRGNLPGKILNILIHNGILTRFKGSEGWVYAPNRQYAGRMKEIVERLNKCDDPIWIEVGDLAH